MKKLLSLIIALVLVLMVGACTPTSNTELEDRIEVLETQVAILNEFYENVVPSTGLNNQTDYYVNETEYYLSANYMELMFDSTEKDYLDKTKFPDYIWDDLGEYISINELCNKLTLKYLGVFSTGYTGDTFTIKMASIPSEMTEEEFIVRVSMMILELAKYDYYTIDASQLYIEFISGASKYMISRMSLLIEDKYDLHPAIFWNGLLDIRMSGLNYNKLLLEDIYNGFITDETFNGYVLPNYK